MAAFILLKWTVFLLSLSKTSALSKGYALYIYKLEDLVQNELTVIKHFVNDPETTRSLPVFKDIKKYIRDFTWNTGLVVKGGVNWTESWINLHSKKTVENPIGGFTVISRTQKYWPRIFNGTELSGMINFPKDFDYPTEEDLEEALQGVTVIAYTYELNVSEMALGQILGVSTGFKLNSEQCADLSWWAKKNYFAMAVEWLELAIALKKPKSSQKLEKRLERLAEEHDEEKDNYDVDDSPRYFEERLQYYAMCQEPETDDRVAREMYFGKCSEKQRRKNKFICYPPEHPSENPDWNSTYTDECFYSTLCSGANYQTEREKSRLFCWLEFSAHPYFHIGPMKMEYLNRNPDIVQIYQVFSDARIERMLTQASSNFLRMQKEINQDGKGARHKKRRFGMYYWLNDTDPNLGFRKLSQTIEMLLGLEMLKPGSVENLQVTSYSLTGYYYRHDDSHGHKHAPAPEAATMGDRLATLMYYLSDVEAGGSTPFVSSGVSARPVKGSAIFWYNIFSDGSSDDKVAHAACPVLLGRKIVANKWIRLNNQWKSQPCPLNRNQRFQILVNGKVSP